MCSLQGSGFCFGFCNLGPPINELKLTVGEGLIFEEKFRSVRI